MKSKSFVLMTLSLGFGLIAALGITQVMGKNKQPLEPKVKMGQVVVSLDHLGHKALLTEENVRVENWPAEIIPENAVRTLEEVADMAIMTRLSKGLPILKTDIVHKNKAMGMDIPPGFKVVAIKVSADDTIAGLLRPGDLVDVIGLLKKQEGRTSQTVSRTFLKGIQVFSVNSSMKATTSDRSKGGSKGNAIVSLLVNQKQSEDIVFVQRTGSLKLVLRGDIPTDDELAGVEGALARTLNGDEKKSTEAVKPKKQDYEKMVIWVGQDYETVTFEPGRIPKTAFASSTLPEGSSLSDAGPLNKANYGESEAEEEITDEYEEDQYPAQ
ncbi:Flp pilus assembly protein CpaB [Mariniblastus sp.]|nr:Flp pilus assembly protein CpaB [Mariniblastus sp.]